MLTLFPLPDIAGNKILKLHSLGKNAAKVNIKNPMYVG